MRNLTVYDLWPGLSPMQRGALCAVGLTAGFRVQFAWSNGPFYLVIGELGEERTFSLRLHHILHRDKICPQVDEKWLDVLYGLYQRLLVVGAEDAEKPFSREQLGRRLEKIRCLTLSLPVEEDHFLHRFKDCYRQWGEFQLCGERPINPINQRETGVYKEIFAQSAGGVESIDHAVQTLLHLLPGDAHRILDVGAGPGYVNRCLPLDRLVLAMDIDPDILRENRCPTCVGDVLDIPLAEKAVDLCMVCDVLEHIEPEWLPRAISELCRVSGRYLYLQVPYQEQLPASFARCPKCGHIWHVNFHKNSFSLQSLLDLPGEEWEPLAVGFTGEISYQGEESQENQLLESLGLSSYRVEDWKCPVCSARSKDYLREPFDNLHAACSAFPQMEIAPRYSEIAVLFCRKEMIPPKRVRKLLAGLDSKKEVGSRQTNILLFCPDMPIASVYTGSELLPIALCGNCCFDWENNGRLLKGDRDQPSFVSAAFPLRPAFGDILCIRGTTEEDNRLTVCMLDATGQEVLLGEILVGSGIFEKTLTIDYRFSASRAFVKIYFEREGLSLHSVGLSNDGTSAYQLYRAKKGNHLAHFQDKVAFFWYAAQGEPLCMRPKLSQWLAVAERNRELSPSLLPDYIGLLRGIIGKQRQEYERASAEQFKENTRLSQRLEISEAKGDELQCQLKKEKQRLQELEGLLKLANDRENLLHQQLEKKETAVLLLESVRCRLQLQVEEQAAAVLLLESIRCKLQLQVEEQAAALTLSEQQITVLRLELTQTKERLALCGTFPTIRPKKRLALRAWTATALRRLCRISVRVVHKIPYLYPLLVRMGVKKVYNQLKLKIKSGERYE